MKLPLMAVSYGSSPTKSNPNRRNITEKDDVDFVRANRLHRRLNSFKNWNSRKSHMQLALAGFSYTGFEDKVECEDCKKRILKWTLDDDPLEIHYRLSPSCPFLKDLGFSIDQQIPKYRKYANYASRLKSMQNIPQEFVECVPSHEALASSGFFYQGTLDRMCCFQCALVLRDWEPDSIPNEVHKKYSNNCRFIDTIMENQRTRTNNSITTNADNSNCDQEEKQEQKNLLTSITTVARKTEQKAPENLVNQVATNTLQDVASCMKRSQQPSLNIKHRPIGRFSCQSSYREFSKRADRNYRRQWDEVDSARDSHKNSKSENPPSLLDRQKEQTTNSSTNVGSGASANLALTAIEEAVLEMGYRLEDIVKVKNERIERGEGEFEDAESLCLAVMNLVENTDKSSPES